MATTTYTVLDANDNIVKEGVSKKSAAIQLAEEGRASSRKTHRVLTNKGTEVHVVKGVRGMKITPAYSRTVELPEGFVAPEGTRVAYTRSRKGVAILHVEETGEYALFDYVKGEMIAEELPTTRAAGAAVKALPALAAV